MTTMEIKKKLCCNRRKKNLFDRCLLLLLFITPQLNEQTKELPFVAVAAAIAIVTICFFLF